MVMDRRRFVTISGVLTAAALFPRLATAQERFIAAQGAWRKFDLVTTISFSKPQGKAQAWVPVPSVNAQDWSKALGSDWKTNATTARLERLEEAGLDLVYLEWDEPEGKATVTISSHAETRDRITDFTKPVDPASLGSKERQHYTAPVSFLQHTDWLREKAAEVTENAKTDLGKAKAIYEWIIEERDCAVEDLKMLLGIDKDKTPTPQSCNYLNTLFVHMARIAGLPAREIYGVRVAPSKFGVKTLGADSEDVTSKDSSRAEIWLSDYGWVPASPGDVRRVISGGPAGMLDLSDPKAVSARVTLFGAWEGNWLAYNSANDFLLPETKETRLPFLIAPHIITANGPVSKNSDDTYRWKIEASELPS